MKVGDLVHFVSITDGGRIREDTHGMVLGFHPERSWSTQVIWFDMGITPTPDGPGYWPQSTLKVYSESR